MKKRMTDNFAVRLLGTLLLSSPFTLLLTRLHCIKFSIVQCLKSNICKASLQMQNKEN